MMHERSVGLDGPGAVSLMLKARNRILQSIRVSRSRGEPLAQSQLLLLHGHVYKAHVWVSIDLFCLPK